MGTRPKGALLVGAVNLETVPDVFREVASALSDRLRRIPDGEPGSRRQWISYQYPLLASKTFLEWAETPAESGRALVRLKLCAGVGDDEIRFGELGYSREARASYLDFKRLKEEGKIPRHCRLQICLPGPLSVVGSFIVRDSQKRVGAAYERDMLREVERICASVPHDELAIQWDLAYEMVWWDRQIFDRSPNFPRPYFDDIEGELTRAAKRWADAVPSDVELGVHLCYGDFKHKHFIEPQDCRKMTELANAISAAVTRRIEWMHLPIPRQFMEAQLFAPLADLKLHPETELYLGLIHNTDGLDGARKRIALAQTFVNSFGVATECGWGRRPSSAIASLLKIHAATCDAVA